MGSRLQTRGPGARRWLSLYHHILAKIYDESKNSKFKLGFSHHYKHSTCQHWRTAHILFNGLIYDI